MSNSYIDGVVYPGASGTEYGIGSPGTLLSDQMKQALLACFAQVAWIGDDGQDYYDALEAALYPPINLVSISAVYTQSGTVYDTDTLDSLRSGLVVTAAYSDSSTSVVTTYTLSGTLAEGTSTITVAYGGKTTTFNVTVVREWDISWDYTDGMPDETIFTKIDNGTTSSTLTDNGLEISVKGTSTEFGYSYESSYSTGVIEAVFNFNAIEAYAWVTFGDGTNRIATRSQYSANYKGIYLCTAASISSMTKLQTTALNTDYKLKVVLDNGYGEVYINDTLAQGNISVASIQAGATKIPVFKVNGNDSSKTGKIILKSIKIKLGRTA